MSFKVDAELVTMFRGLISSLKPYAEAQEVDLSFESSIQHLYLHYHPKDIIPDLTVLITHIISFTPQSYKVVVSLDGEKPKSNSCSLSIINTGVSLANINEIHNKIKFKTIVESSNKDGTHFKVEIPIISADKIPKDKIFHNSKSNLFLPYYAEVTKRLKSHFGSINEIENLAFQNNHSQGVFLKKVNAIIASHINDSNFSVDMLANSVALSRTQLFRKIKGLTKMSPGRYILFFRLQKAKQLLQSKEKDLNVSDVCYDVGFVSKSHFTRSFQKQFGFNPSQCK